MSSFVQIPVVDSTSGKKFNLVALQSSDQSVVFTLDEAAGILDLRLIDLSEPSRWVQPVELGKDPVVSVSKTYGNLALNAKEELTEDVVIRWGEGVSPASGDEFNVHLSKPATRKGQLSDPLNGFTVKFEFKYPIKMDGEIYDTIFFPSLEVSVRLLCIDDATKTFKITDVFGEGITLSSSTDTSVNVKNKKKGI